jgi:hypothetical protein
MSELPVGWKPPSIGMPAELQTRLKQVFPGHRHIDGQTSVEGDSFHILLNYKPRSHDGAVESISVQSTPAPEAMAQLQRACELLGLRLFDCQTGELADFSSETASSMESFAAWRERELHQIDRDKSNEQ